MQELHAEMESMFCAKEDCYQIISDEEHLKDHWAIEHTKSTYQCLKCFKRFENKHFVENHIRNAHAHAHSAKMLKTEENQSNEE